MFKHLLSISLLAFLLATVVEAVRFQTTFTKKKLVLTTTVVTAEIKNPVTTVTKSKTVRTTVVTTVTSSSHTVCANYVNATTACRRKRHYWIDQPIVVALDDEVDPFIDQFINPSGVFSLEPTAVANFRSGVDNEYKNSLIQASLNQHVPQGPFSHPYGMQRNGYDGRRPFRPFRPSVSYVAVEQLPAPSEPEARFGALAIIQYLAEAFKVAPSVTTTDTITKTSTTTATITGTGTVIISGCKPPGITYSSCKK